MHVQGDAGKLCGWGPVGREAEEGKAEKWPWTKTQALMGDGRLLLSERHWRVLSRAVMGRDLKERKQRDW